MSGLLVKSTVVMRENLEEMTPPGARHAGDAGRRRADPRAMSRTIASRPMPAGRVAYARDAFDGLDLMDKIVGNDFDGYLAEVQAQERRHGRVNPTRKLGRAADARAAAPGRCRGDPRCAAPS